MSIKQIILSALILICVCFIGCGQSYSGGSTSDISVSSVSPADGATGVSASPSIIVNFTKALKADSITSAGRFAVRVKSSGADVPGAISVSDKTATFTPSATLEQLTTYEVFISGEVQSSSNKKLPAEYRFSFKTLGCSLSWAVVYDNAGKLDKGYGAAAYGSYVYFGINKDTEGDSNSILARYNTSGQNLTEIDSGAGASVFKAMTADGNNDMLIVAKDASLDKYYIIKFSRTDGSKSSFVTWEAATGDDIEAVCVDGDNNIYVAGTSAGGNGLVVKLTSQGSEVWRQTFSVIANLNGAENLTVDSSGNVYICGWTGNNEEGNVTRDMVVAKYDSTGANQWIKTYGTAGIVDNGLAIALDSSNNVYVCALTDYSLAEPRAQAKATVLKYNNSDGRLLSTVVNYEGEGFVSPASQSNLVFDSSGSMYIWSFLISGQKFRPSLLKFNSSGSLLWQNAYTPSGIDDYHVIAYGPVVFDGSGNIYALANRIKEDYESVILFKFIEN